MKRLLCLFVLCFLFTSLAMAQTAVVKRNVNLRSDASTDSDVIEALAVGTHLQMVEPDKTNGYYHVTVPDGQDGWVWARNIRLLPLTPTPTPSPTTSGDLFSQLMNARKTAVGQPLVEDGIQVCGPTGNTTNPT